MLCKKFEKIETFPNYKFKSTTPIFFYCSVCKHHKAVCYKNSFKYACAENPMPEWFENFSDFFKVRWLKNERKNI